MSNPNPLIPQGTFQAQAARGASNVRIAVATIVAIHVVFFGGLLLQGCKRETPSGEMAENAAVETNEVETNVSLALPPLDTNSLYYSSQSGLPPETGSMPPIQQPVQETNPLIGTAGTQQQTPEQLWQATNLNAPIGGGTQTGGSMLNNGALSAGMKEYTVVARDTLGKIAQQHGTTVNALMAANPTVEPRRIRPGDKILIPEGSPATRQSGSDAGSNSAVTGSGNGSMTVYEVRSGDNLTRIANRHGVTIQQIRDANNLRTSRINVGQKLKIPAKRTTASNGPVTSNPAGF